MSDEIIKFIRRQDYRFVKELGRGGCGMTVLLHDDFVGHKLVCKKFDPHSAALKTELYAAFLAEIKLMYRVFHRNIVRIYTHHVVPGHELGYILMEHIEGEAIDKFLERNPDSFLTVLRQTVDAFCHLEELRILHRDVRYENILVAQDGTVKLIDLGFGKPVERPQDFFKSVTLNWPASPPTEFHDQRYDFRTEVYFVGRLFKRIGENISPIDRRAEGVIRRMCFDDPSKRTQSFGIVRRELDEVRMDDVMFSEEEVEAYREFSGQLWKGTKEARDDTVFDGAMFVFTKLEELYRQCMLEQHVSAPTVAICFVERGGFAGEFDDRMQVDTVKKFLRMLRTCDEERRGIAISNVIRRLEGLPVYAREIPF